MANTKITSRVLADNAVLTANITDANVTTAKVADNAVTGDKVSDNVALAGNPTTTTQSAGNNTTRIATTAFVSTAVANLADSAPDALNTLNELAAAMGDDANFSTTITNSIAAKLPLAGGTMTGALDLDGQELKLDADADTSITADTDDVVDFKVGGTDRLRLSGNNLFLNGATDARIQLGSGGAGANTVGNNTVHIRGDGVDAKYMAASGGDHIFESNGGHLVTMKDSGKVGIGNASPSHMLHVNAADGASDNTQAMTIENNEATDGRSYGLKIKAGSTANDASLFVQDHDASNDHFIIRGNGNVGIGTTSPATTLHLDASGGAVMRLQRTSANATNKLELSHDGTDGTITSTNDLNLNYGDVMSIGLNHSNGSNYPVLRFDNNGYATISSSTGATQLKFQDSGGNTDGYVYAESGSIGFLDDDGHWFYKANTDTDHRWYVNNSTKAILNGSGVLSITGTLAENYSDDRLKTNKVNISNALNKVGQLNGFTYTPNSTAQDLGFSNQKQAGVSAQEVEAVLPEAVQLADAVNADHGTDYKTVQYSKLVPLLIESIKELKARIETLEG